MFSPKLIGFLPRGSGRANHTVTDCPRFCVGEVAVGVRLIVELHRVGVVGDDSGTQQPPEPQPLFMRLTASDLGMGAKNVGHKRLGLKDEPM